MLGCAVPFASTQFLVHKILAQNIIVPNQYKLYCSSSIYVYIYSNVVMGSGIETFMSYIKILVIISYCLL
jgi:hypothetical protein